MLRRRALPLALAPFLAIRPAAAQSWPSKPLRMIIPWPPGQATDVIGRLIANLLTPALGQPVVPENRPGAGGMIGTDIVAKGPADGHALPPPRSGRSPSARWSTARPMMWRRIWRRSSPSAWRPTCCW